LAGIYIHIPFCKHKCHYCNFFSLASTKYRNAFLDALLKEISLERYYLGSSQVDTVYFGGGTPSLLGASGIQKIFDTLVKNFSLSSRSEITLEANPDDLNRASLIDFHSIGINRLSIGIQSFFEEDLRALDRIHNASATKQSILDAKIAGFQNLCIDLIYGIPGLTLSRWDHNLEIAFSLEIPHISAYSLTVEANTALYQLILRKKINPPDEESSIDQFRLLMQKMKAHDYIHYEISNFCRDGFYSKHNSNYWKGVPYLGLGPSAHSFNGISRKWNISNLTNYIQNIQSGISVSEEETLTTSQRFNEYIMTSLRTVWGCSSKKIIDDFGFTIYDSFRKAASLKTDQDLLKEVDGTYLLTEKGKLFADGIASDLFIIES